jgi:hypothetical protein
MKAIAIAMAAALVFVSTVRADDQVEIDFDQVPALHIPLGKRVVSARPAFEDYAFMLFDVCDALSLEGDDCLIYPLNASLGGNAVATIFDGNRVIIYDRELSPLVGYEGAEMIIAHELAHHHCGHIGTPPDPKQELAADALAGAAARLMGRSLAAALSAVSVLAERPSSTHPGRQARIEAVTAGWNDPEQAKSC